MWKLRSIACLLFVIVLSGCGALNNTLADKTKTQEYYRIYDIKTSADRFDVAKAASDGLGRNAGDIQENSSIPTSADLPEKPGRFEVVNALEGTQMGKFAALTGNSMAGKTAVCKDAVWTAKAAKNVSNNFSINLTACLFEYKEGFHMDMYAHMTKKEGGLMQLSRSMSSALVGTPEEWVEKVFVDTANEVYKKTNADISFVEGYPKATGTPWFDGGGKVAASK